MSVTVDHSVKSFPKAALVESVRLPAMAELTDAKRRIIERVKRADSITASELAGEFGLTDTAIRQHLEALEAVGLVSRKPGPAIGRGRPPVHWRGAPAPVRARRCTGGCPRWPPSCSPIGTPTSPSS